MNPQQTKRLKAGLIGAAVLSAIAAAWSHLAPLASLEQGTIDYRYAHFNREKVMSHRVAYLDIDEESLKLLEPVYGRWPWPRRVYKDLIEFFSAGEPAGIFFDVQFGEKQLGADDDALLGETAAATGIASFAMSLFDPVMPGTAPPEALPADFKSRFSLNGAALANYPIRNRFRNFSVPNQDIYTKATRIHSVDAVRDQDGVSRRIPLLFNYGESWVPGLSVAAVSAALGPKTALKYEQGQLKFIPAEGTPLTVPVGSDGNLELHFYSRERETAPIPIAAAIDSALKMQRGEVGDPAELKVNPLEFKGKVIILGASAAGLEDLKSTPIHPAYPGPLLHATAISNILEQDFSSRPHDAVKWVITVLAIVLGYVCSLWLDRGFLRFALPLLGAGAYLAAALYLFRAQGLILDLASPLVLGAIALSHGFAYMSLSEGAERRRMQSTLSKYLSPAVSAQLIASGSDPRAEIGRAEELSVMFTDIRGFTTLSERLEAQIVVERLNEYLGKMIDVVFEYTGTLDKFIGDALMAFWNAPVKDPEHAVRAVRCGFKMREELKKLNEGWLSSGALASPLGIGMGINTGEVIVGNIGSEKRLDYTVIGDKVNLASRIEGLTKQYHLDFLVGERTEALGREAILFREVDWVKVKGKKEPVAIHEPLCERNSPEFSRMSELKAAFEAALKLYRAGAFADALKAFEKICREKDDGAAEVYVERCRELVESPPENWDGVFVAKSK